MGVPRVSVKQSSTGSGGALPPKPKVLPRPKLKVRKYDKPQGLPTPPGPDGKPQVPPKPQVPCSTPTPSKKPVFVDRRRLTNQALIDRFIRESLRCQTS